MTPLETYLRALREDRSAGVPETSSYPALSNLLNEVGKELKPRVRCIIHPPNRGSGIPDGGLFTADQFPKAPHKETLPGQIPKRGAIEVKPTSEEVTPTAHSEQVTRYLDRYGQVLVTNYRDFVLVRRDQDGNPVILEKYSLADDESEFWAAAATPRAFEQKHGARFIEYLQRVMLHAAPLAAPEDVAWSGVLCTRRHSPYRRRGTARLSDRPHGA